MKTLYVDMDGVVCCFETGVKIIEPEMAWVRKEVDRVCESNPRVFLTLPEIDGAVKAVKELRHYFDVYFLTTPMQNVPHSYMDKRLYLKDKFGEWANKRLILTHRKDLNIGEFLIDDRIKNGVDKFQGEHIHFGTEKFPNWESVVNYLKTKA